MTPVVDRPVANRTARERIAARRPVTFRLTGDSVVYFSSTSGNTRRFVEKLEVAATQVPLEHGKGLTAQAPYVLILPTYGAAGRGHVPPAVVRFLNDSENRSRLIGVIGAGNRNFYDTYCLAADIIATKCGVPVLDKFELMGTPEDVLRVQEGLERLWK